MRGSTFSMLLLCSTFFVLLRAEGQPAQSQPISGANPVPILIELFTSEGCSSCPPADMLLQKLDTTQPIPGAQLIVLSEHVTYWDHDGWKDPSSSAALTDRQNSYESVLGSDTAYTPQMIVDGTHELHLRNSKETEDILLTASRTPKLPVRIGAVSIDSKSPLLRMHVETAANNGKHTADVYAAVALDHVESQVLRGENGGKHLVHVAVVQELTKIGKIQKEKAFAQDVQLKLKPGTDSKNLRLIVFVQASGPGELLGAAQWKPQP